MTNFSLESCGLRQLNFDELINVNAGAPSPTTSFWYDLSYYAAKGLKALGRGAAMIKG